MKILCQCKNGYQAKFINEAFETGVINFTENNKEIYRELLSKDLLEDKVKMDFFIEDNGWKGNILAFPCEVHELVDVIFSHNSIIALWVEDENDSHYSNILWQGMAHSIPEEYKKYTFKSIQGVVAENIRQSNIININVTKPEDD